MYRYTHETISYRRDLVTLQAGVGEDNSHNFYLTANSNPGVDYLSSKPNWNSSRVSNQDSYHVGTTDKPTSTDGSPHDKPCAARPTMNATFHFLYLSMHMPNGKPELGVTPGTKSG